MGENERKEGRKKKNSTSASSVDHLSVRLAMDASKPATRGSRTLLPLCDPENSSPLPQMGKEKNNKIIKNKNSFRLFAA